MDRNDFKKLVDSIPPSLYGNVVNDSVKAVADILIHRPEFDTCTADLLSEIIANLNRLRSGVVRNKIHKDFNSDPKS